MVKKPKLERKGSFESICDMDLNESLGSRSGSDVDSDSEDEEAVYNDAI